MPELSLTSLNLNAKPLTADFNTLLNRELDAAVLVTDSLSNQKKQVFTIDSVLYKQPKINAVKAGIEALDFEAALADLKRKPNIGVGLDYGFISKREGINLEDNGKGHLNANGLF